MCASNDHVWFAIAVPSYLLVTQSFQLFTGLGAVGIICVEIWRVLGLGRASSFEGGRVDFRSRCDARTGMLEETKVDAFLLRLDAPANDMVVLNIDPAQDV